MQSTHAKQSSNDDADRTNRFLSSSSGADTPNTLSLRERAASQPPRSSNSQGFLASPSLQSMRTNSGGGPGAWPRFSSGLNPDSSLQPGLPSSVPTRSSSFSARAGAGATFSSAMRDSRFASTFEDDESEALSDMNDPYDDRYYGTSPPAAIGSGIPGRGRTYAADMTRSRSQSVATTTRPGLAAFNGAALWNDAAFSSSNPLSIPGSGFDRLKPAGSSRYGSLGALGRSPSNGYSHGAGSFTDQSNMSPFVRDLQQIMNDDVTPYRDPWLVRGGSDEGGGGSGTTSRRHSVSVIARPRPSVIGFNAPGLDPDEPVQHGRSAGYSFSSASSGGGLLLTDDDLAGDLGLLSLGASTHDTGRSPHLANTAAPSSLPSGSGLARSPAYERLSPYQPLHLNIPGGPAGSYRGGGALGSPSDSAFSGGSPSRHQLEGEYPPVARENVGRGLTARFVPGQGIQHIPESSILTPITPGGQLRGNYGGGAMQRRASDATKSITELGKGVPLHAMPTSWPLFIVEFKAGRTDLFYCTDLTLDIRVGDLVIVEADRGRDLGKIVNDTITLAEVEEFQRQQKVMSSYAEAQGQMPTSPTGQGAKEINPKQIYEKARAENTQVLAQKLADEAKALELCRTKVKQRKLPMEVVDAEYQW